MALTGLAYAGAMLIAAQGVAETPYQAGMDARTDGDFAAAAEYFRDEVDQQPENSDAWVQLGLSLIPLERYDEAAAAFRRALELAPDYQDARIGLARLAFYRGDYEEAKRLARQAGDRDDARALLAQIEAAEAANSANPWRADLTVGRSELTQDLPGWTEASAALGRRVSDRASVTGLVEYARRFSDEDVYLQARWDQRIRPRVAAYVALGGAPSADFRPELAALAGITFPLTGDAGDARGLYGVLSGSAARYQTGEVAGLTSGLRYVFTGDQARMGANLITLVDENNDTRHGFALNAEWQFAGPARLILGYADAPETSENVTIDVQSYTAGVRYDVNDRVGIQTYFIHEKRSAYDRSGVVLGTSWRF
ncbi:MAG: YaiO family outer membrane beta-barrel protein [Euryhalocaulis sp.]|uniref:YaiO family outer membrane beta-barrel protein n=1 Tax=Euryhalocaulis sp. TaxID=2744307 RepID=UPI001851B0BB|nr:YaiO family outer membrane beta-barrel protein [Euryhalocaulis sp.]MBA4801314.1 YaiO family outer membrane beta-barrel protein [Euryhalocaulis sp.]